MKSYREEVRSGVMVYGVENDIKSISSMRSVRHDHCGPHVSNFSSQDPGFYMGDLIVEVST